ncbi:MAG: hypothetical protein IJ072_03395 [Oscillospiraceae bacterium]|nr:hypothetical protein [Oscillospiraceae bacterium]
MSEKEKLTLTDRERELIDTIRSVGYGEIDISVEKGQLKAVTRVKQSIMLNIPGGEKENH